MGRPDSAATDVGEFITDLDGGQFDTKLSIAISQTAAAVVDHDREGEVNIKLKFKKIPGTSQVHVKHKLVFSKPTMHGTASEEEERSTPMHVGKFGKTTLTPENQMTMFDAKSGAPTPPSGPSY